MFPIEDIFSSEKVSQSVFSIMKALITGGAGFVGSNLAITLQELGHRVTVLDNFLTGDLKNLRGFNGKILKGNEQALVGLAEGFDVIFHLASITDTTFLDKDKMFRNNVEGFRFVINLCQKNSTRLVFASSAAVYGDGEVPMKEDQNPRPLNVYAESKLKMERMAIELFEGGTLVGLRFFNVFGPREHFKGKMASMIYKLAIQMKKGKRPTIFKHGEQLRDHIYVRDVVETLIKSSNYEGFGLFNVGTGIETSFNELIGFLNKTLGTNYEPEYFDNPYESSYQNVTVADTKKAIEELNFRTFYSVEDGIKDYIDWLYAMGWNN